MHPTFDVLCIGGGVIGLATAWELRGRGLAVCVVDKGAIGNEASWAGAGIIPPASLAHSRGGMELLRAHSFAAYPIISERLRDLTDRDIGFRQTGGIELPESAEDKAELERMAALGPELGIRVEALTRAAVQELEPAIEGDLAVGYWFPDVCQVRNPWLLKALEQACSLGGVRLLPHAPVEDFEAAGARIAAVRAGGTRIVAGQVLVAAGAWSGTLMKALGVSLPVRPIRGQIVALRGAAGIVRHIVMVGKRYVVPRTDGLVLIGSTEEDVGFEKRVTAAGTTGLRRFANSWFPALDAREVEKAWAGLRPSVARDFPCLGRVAGWDNAWVATGHFRQGIQLAPGTARLLADWIVGKESFATENEFALDAAPQGERIAFRS